MQYVCTLLFSLVLSTSLYIITPRIFHTQSALLNNQQSNYKWGGR